MYICFRSSFILSAPNSAIKLHINGRRFHPLTASISEPQNPLYYFQMSTHPMLDSVKEYPVMDLGHCCESIYNQLSIDTLNIMQRSLKDKSFWEAERQFRITGSRCYALFTYNNVPRTEEQWSLKASKYFWPKSFTNKYVKHGIAYEDVARKIYTEKFRLNVVECGLVTNKNNPWLGYTPDGVILNGNMIPIKLIEIKCPFKGKVLTLCKLVEELPYILKDSNGLLSLKSKHAYYAQIQLGLVLLNVPSCDLIIHDSLENDILVINVSFDSDYAKQLIFNLKVIYFEKLLHEVCKIKYNL